MYYFFWNGPLSQWHPSKFREDGICYENCEQYMMAKKAELFNDNEAQRLILQTVSPKSVKALGRSIKNFDQTWWDECKYHIVRHGNILKFSQNINLRNDLKATGELQIVEASPEDRIWGIGYREELALNHTDNWGENLLGKILVEVRSIL